MKRGYYKVRTKEVGAPWWFDRIDGYQVRTPAAAMAAALTDELPREGSTSFDTAMWVGFQLTCDSPYTRWDRGIEATVEELMAAMRCIDESPHEYL